MAIKSFADADTQALFGQQRVRRWVNMEAVALRKLAMERAKPMAAVAQDLIDMAKLLL